MSFSKELIEAVDNVLDVGDGFLIVFLSAKGIWLALGPVVDDLDGICFVEGCNKE